MESEKEQRIIYFFIFLLGLIPLLWFKGELITGTDVDFPLFPEERLEERFYTWYPKIQLGTNRSNNIGSLPYFLVVFLFSKLGFSLIVVEKTNVCFLAYLNRIFH